MSNTLNDIRDDEIRVIRSTSHVIKSTADNNNGQPGRWNWLFGLAILIVLIVVAILLLNKAFSGGGPEAEVITPVIVQEPAKEINKPSFTEINDTIINDVNLRIYNPQNAKASLTVGQFNKQDTTIVLIAQAADVRADNGEIVGSFVLNGEVLSEGSSKEGFCAIIGDEIAIGVAKNSSLFERAIDEKGCFFRQWSLVNNGVLVDDNPKGKSIRRALCQQGDEVFVVESIERESFHDFSQSLVDMGVNNAIYLVGSSAYGWAKDKDGNRVEFGQETEAFTNQHTSYIVWR